MTDPITRLNAALEGRYRVERELGAGGMATVYLAQDLKHDRQVAIKVLRPELAAVIGADRFLAEIKTTANLQHPHILPLFDSGESDGFLYYVMPFIDGESLREQLDREKQLGVEEAVRITKDVADALEYAHSQGVIHRDIKPANILLHRGRPVVADFGIAVAISAAGGGRMTETGLSLGTPHYMSPEQASADRDLSARSDVYSLGCVLYEMIAGQPPHTGPSAQSVLVRIMTETPRSLTELRHTVPPHVASAVAKAAEKLPADRFESAEAFAQALDDPTFTYAARPVGGAGSSGDGALRSGTGPAGVDAAAASRSGWLAFLPWGLVAVLALLLVLVALRSPAPDPEVPVRFRLTDFGGVIGLPFGRNVAISPDGSVMAVVGLNETGYGLFLRRSDDPEFRLIPGTENRGAVSPAFSPDGQWIVFEDGDQLRKVAVAGGPVLPVAVGEYPHWATQDEIVFGDEGGLYSVSSSGGTPSLLLADSLVEGSASRPFLLPGGKGLLFQRTLGAEGRWVMLLDRESGEIREIGQGTSPSYSPTGHLVFGHREQYLLAVPFDLETLSTRGSPVPVIPSLTVYGGGATQFGFSETGTLIYGDRGAQAEGGVLSQLAWVDMEGNAEPLPLRATDPVHPRIAPDGRRVTYLDQRQVWVYDLETGTNSQLTFEGINEDPIWSHDGLYVYFTAEREGSLDQDGFRQRADGSVEAEPLWRVEGENEVLSASRDGRYIVVRDDDGTGVEGMDLAVLDMEADSATLESYLRGDWGESQGSISPDGRWMVYVSSESGENEVYVRGFPDPRGQWRVSDSGGRSPVWAPDGSAIYYVSADAEMVKVEIRGGDTFSVGSRTRLFDFRYSTGPSGNVGYDIHPEGDRFLVRGRLGVSGNPVGEVYVVVNWFEELKARVGEAR